MVPKAEFRSYYGRPILKRPVWEWQIPAYFFAGGVAAGSSALALGGRLTGRHRLARRSRWTALAAISASTAFLIDDLGRPERFLNMLRVVKPTSPMSMGSWLLALYGPSVGAAAVLPGRLSRMADTTAAALAPAVCTYTAVILADTAIPAWHDAKGVLPWLFASGAAASAGGIAAALVPVEEAAPARRLALVGAAAELVAARQVTHVSEVYDNRLARTAKALTLAGAATLLLKGRPAAIVGGALVAAGAAVTRFAVAEAGNQSADDPAYVVAAQTS